MRTTPRLALAVLIAVVALLAGCSSASNGQATRPTTLVVNSAVLTDSTSPTTPLAATPTASPAATVVTTPLAATTLPATTVLPTSTAPAGASVTIARGGFITKVHGSCNPTNCKYVQITSSGWTPKQPLAVTCYSSSGSSGPYTKYADSSGNLSVGTVCFFGNATNVYVAIDGVNSNVVTPWKDW